MRYWIADTLVARMPISTDACEVFHPVTHSWEPAPELAPQIREGGAWRPVTAADAFLFAADLPATG